MQVVNKESVLWSYMSEHQKGLILDGEQLLAHAESFTDISDYSFLVFSFSKAYEGFLKTLFLDLKLIHEDDYYGDDIRIGRILNPSFRHEKESVYGSLCLDDVQGEAISKRLWEVWRRGRNRVFHYFPHNYKKISYEEAVEIIEDIAAAMVAAVEKCHLQLKPIRTIA